MTFTHHFLRRAWRHMLWLPMCLMALSAHAGSISFNLSINDNKLTLSHQGDASAFHPVVLRMQADGRWQTLQPLPGTQAPVEFKPGAQFTFAWPDRRPVSSLAPIETLRPVMVRFFDQAGAGFGQISFFNHPLNATEDLSLKAGYVNGRMTIAPPTSAAIRATWLLWPKEQGIAALTEPVQPKHHQPDARRLTWQSGADKVSVDLGKGLPAAHLLHETEDGYRLQIVPNGGVQGRQQRAGWLEANERFYFAARLALAAALALLLWPLLSFWRNRNAPKVITK
jgi:hypothetical protein